MTLSVWNPSSPHPPLQKKTSDLSMRILEVMAGGEHGGAETAFVDTCIAFKEAGHAIEVVTRDNDIRVPRLRDSNIKVHLLPFGGRFDLVTTPRLRSIAQDFQPDIIQTWMSRGSQKTPEWSPRMGIPRYAVIPRLGGYYKLKYFKSASDFTTITPMIRDYLIEQGVAPDRVTHINNFAETEEVITPINRSDFDTLNNAPLILGLGRLHDAKAFDTLIKAVKDVPGAYLWIAGEGPDRQDLEALIKTLGLTDRVKLLGWRDDRAALFQAADICCFTSRYEPFGTVFVQSWAQKTPVIASDADGPRQFVHDQEDGLIVPVDNIKRLSTAITLLLKDKALAQTLVKNGYQRYLDEFTKEKTVSAYIDLFANIKARIRGPHIE